MRCTSSGGAAMPSTFFASTARSFRGDRCGCSARVLSGDPKSEADPAWMEPAKIVEQVVRLGAREDVALGGRLPVNPRGPMEHAMVKNTAPEYQDQRDWDEIRACAAGITSELGAAVRSA
jgi:hypothetical protein